MQPIVTLVPGPSRTRVLLSVGQDEMLRAALPSLSTLKNRRAVTTFLEALSLWMDERLFVALSAGAEESCFCCGLTDELGTGTRSVFYAVERLQRLRRRGRRLTGVGDFTALRQLSLVPFPEERR